MKKIKRSDMGMICVLIAIVCFIASFVIFVNISGVCLVAELSNTPVPAQYRILSIPFIGTTFVGATSFYKYLEIREAIAADKAARKNKKRGK